MTAVIYVGDDLNFQHANIIAPVRGRQSRNYPEKPYITAWVNPHDNRELSKKEIRFKWMTVWIEAAAVGANPDTLLDLCKHVTNTPSSWLEMSGCWLTAAGIVLGKADHKDYEGWTTWKLRWAGLDESEAANYTGIRFGLLGALARFAWSDPLAWQVHIAGELSPVRIAAVAVTPHRFDESNVLDEMNWWPPGDSINRHNWTDPYFPQSVWYGSLPRKQRQNRPAIASSGWGA